MSSSNPNIGSILDAALESYRRKTKENLASHPVLPNVQQCGSSEDILNVLQEHWQINRSQNSDDKILKWIIPTVKVLSAFSNILGEVVGPAFPPVKVIFAGIGVLASAAKDASACQDKLIEIFNRIEHFFQRLNIYISITPITATNPMMGVVVEIVVEVINILAITTKEVKSASGRLTRKLRLKKFNPDVGDSLKKLENLLQEEVWMAAAESLRAIHSVGGRVMVVDNGVGVVRDTVKGVGGKVQDVLGEMQVVGNRVQGVEESVQAVQSDMKDVGDWVQGIDRNINDISSDVRGVNDRLNEIKQNQLSDSRDNLLRWLSAPDPSINHIHALACRAHYDDTAQWFLQGRIYNQWKSSGSLLWIHGKPGSGKTVLCSSIINDIEALHDAGTAFMAKFYFDFRDVDKQNLHNLVSSLLKQFSARSDPCWELLSQLYSKHLQGKLKPGDHVECLKEMLRLEAQAQVPTYIIMDALDECPIDYTIPSPREEVLEFVDELVGLHIPNLHICVTSRPEHDIRVVLERLTEHPVSLHDETGQQEDIVKYVASFVRSNQQMKRWREEDKDLVVKVLSERANGMFKWVSCQLGVLQHCFPPSIRRILDDLPKSLDETYERILREILEHNQEHAHRLLQCLVAAVRPLKVEELAEILAFDFDAEGIPKLNLGWRWEDQEEEIMSVCSNLVTIVKDQDSRIVQFSHFSVKEFLTAKRLAEPFRDVSRYYIRPETAHTVLIRACLGVLLRLDDDADQDNIKNFPLAHYSAQYWTTHARFQVESSHMKDALKDAMECLFDADKPHFATWLWIYNDDQDGRSMPTMRPEKPEAVPLYYAASFGFRDLAEHLITKHPEHVTAKGGKAMTPVHVAAREGYADILSLLLGHGADVDGRDLNGQTPLHRAAWTAKVDTGKYLLDHGANINDQCDYKYTPLLLAAIQGHAEFARMLLERGAAIDVRIMTGDSPLHLAAQVGEVPTVQLLLEHGADVNACNIYDQTPSELASGKRRQEIVKLLLKYGAEYIFDVVP